jgi:hypothetical protein
LQHSTSTNYTTVLHTHITIYTVKYFKALTFQVLCWCHSNIHEITYKSTDKPSL